MENKITDKENHINDLICEVNSLLDKLDPTLKTKLLDEAKYKLLLMNNFRIFFKIGQYKNTIEVFDDILETCQDLKYSLKDTTWEVGISLLAFNELQTTN